jgi:class 3 adenylate cyclase
LNSKEKQNKIMALQKQNEFDRKQAEQDKKDTMAVDEIKRQKIIKFGFILGFALLLLLSFILYNRNRIKTNANIIITKEKEIAEREKTRSDKLLLNILPIEIANELKENGTSKPHRFPSVTVLFTDFKQFGLISEHLTAEQLVGELDECFSAFDKITNKHGIEKIKTIGDSYMCAGGLPIMNFTHPEDCVNAALEIRDYMEEYNKGKLAKGVKPLEVRIGINTGPVVAGIVGDRKFAYDIWGDTVNLASRMESSGVEGKVNISESTFQLVKDKFNCTYRGKVLAKNKGEVDMYFVERN